MSSRRDEMLKEMGLAPLWRLRAGADVAPQPDAMPATGRAEARAPVMPRDPAEAMAFTDGSEAAIAAPFESDNLAPAPALDPDARRAAIFRMDWTALRAAVSRCVDCVLHLKRNKTVFGVGDEDANWMFIGEGPGADEDAQGDPFVGQAGRLLDNMLAAIDLKRGENVYIANVVKCLRYNALVQLGDGSWERIGRLVASRYSGDVMSVDPAGALVRRKVVGWHASPLAGRQVFRLTYASSKTAGASKSCVQLTGDHPVLTRRGWVPVEQLTEEDRIATGQGLSEIAFDVVCGSLLGDSHINAKNAHLSVSHSAKQSEYAHLKAELLAEFDCHVEDLAVTARVGGDRSYAVVRVRTRAHRALAMLRTEFYGPGKRVPQWLETGLNDRMLAFWFMDDGYMRLRTNRRPRAEIATCSFTDQDIQILLRGLFNLGLRAKSLRGRIYFDADASEKLARRIAAFVPSSMRYKLHPEVERQVPYDPTRFDPGPVRVMYDKVHAEKVIHEASDRTFYCLDVDETANFVTSGGVVHNCRPPGNRNPAPDEAQKCEAYLQRQIELIRPKLIVALGRVAALNLLAQEASIASLRGRVLDYKGTPLIVTYHPAYLLRTPADKAKAWEDLCFAVKTMQSLAV